MIKLPILLIFLSFQSFAFDHSFKKWDSLLNKYVKRSGHQTLFNYKELKKDNKEFELILSTLSGVTKNEYASFTKGQKLAFLINSYNAFTVKIIIKNYPVKSIKDIGSLFTNTWKIRFFKFLGKKEFYLDGIEHGIIRKKFNEPRIHFAVNCASIGCPSLLEEAFLAITLDSQLDKAAKNFVMNTSKNKLTKKGLKLSAIFKWYGDDFIKTYGSYKKFLSKYLGKKALKAQVDFLDYDWKLNEVK
jgi:hypothetical protein